MTENESAPVIDYTKVQLEAARKENRDMLEMSLTDLALYTKGYAEPNSMIDSFFNKLVLARSAEAVREAVETLRKSSEESAIQMAKLTRSYIVATWVLVAANIVLVLFTLFSKH